MVKVIKAWVLADQVGLISVDCQLQTTDESNTVSAVPVAAVPVAAWLIQLLLYPSLLSIPNSYSTPLQEGRAAVQVYYLGSRQSGTARHS